VRWQNVRESLKSKPILEGRLGGSVSLHVERYLLKSIERSVAGLDVTALVTLLGGSRVQEGESGRMRASVLPSQTLLVPAECSTHWHYSGAIDFAVFYFTDAPRGIQKRVRALADAEGAPRLFGDVLVSALARQIVSELEQGARADHRFMTVLARVMLEQTLRVLSTPTVRGVEPGHVDFARIQAVLTYVHEHLAEDLSTPTLARKARVSEAHFRRLFEHSAGTSPHRYVLAARLEQARKLLVMTTMPISRIAADCGFSSQSHLTERFRVAHATTPAEYRVQLRGKGFPRANT
jgi:AraC family transcriptional regulator